MNYLWDGSGYEVYIQKPGFHIEMNWDLWHGPMTLKAAREAVEALREDGFTAQILEVTRKRVD